MERREGSYKKILSLVWSAQKGEEKCSFFWGGEGGPFGSVTFPDGKHRSATRSATHTSTRLVLGTAVPLLSLGPTCVDVLPISSILHQRDVVISWQREVGDAAHQAPQVLPVRVQGNFLHATWGKGSDEKLFKDKGVCCCLGDCTPGNAISLPSAPQKWILIYRLLCGFFFFKYSF